MNSYTLASVRVQRHPKREEGDHEREQKRGHISSAHVPVLLQEIVDLLQPKKGDIVIDATAGEGGHSEALLESADIELLAMDADARAATYTRARLSRFGAHAEVVEANFKDLQEVVKRHSIVHIDKALFDLGWNRGQLSLGRGFSFMHDEPLLMSYGVIPASGFTAADILNTWSEEAIADALFGYAEERYARRIAKKIIEARRKHTIATTRELLKIIASAIPVGYRNGRTHYATKTFQALRIAVNDELRALENGIRAAWKLLSPGGRLAVISFHSIEDRVVKKLFQEFVRDAEGKLLTKKPLIPSHEEVRHNPSARSAKLRGIEKCSL